MNLRKYKTVTRTKRKWLFFKETYEVDVPDGLDHSQCYIWDDRNKQLQIEFTKEQKSIYEKKDKLASDINLVKKIINKGNSLENEINEFKINIKNLEDSEKREYSRQQKMRNLYCL